MDDLISRQAAIDAFDLPIYNITGRENAERVVEYLKAVIQRIKDLPSAQPERKKGKWIWSEENASWCCGACDCVFEEIDWRPEYNFCPNCGARMERWEE